MSTQPLTQQVRWQDFLVVNDVERVIEIANHFGWDDCEIFGNGDMITEPQESKGWELIPADQYKYSIPTEAIGRLHHLINAGIQIKGVIIADDQRSHEEPEKPPEPSISLPALRPIFSTIGKVLLKALAVAAILAMSVIVAVSLIYIAPLLILGMVATSRSSSPVDYDPKLVVLVDDGQGGTTWISLFTWYD